MSQTIIARLVFGLPCPHPAGDQYNEFELGIGDTGTFQTPTGRVFGMLVGTTHADGKREREVTSFSVLDLIGAMERVGTEARVRGLVGPDEPATLRLYTLLDVA